MIIVTGGAGFIGSNIVRALNNMGVDDIVVVDTLRNPLKLKNLEKAKYAELIDKKEFIQNIDRFHRKASAMIHQGACSDTTETDLAYLKANNYDYSVAVFNFCQTERIPLVYASSAAVYGLGEQGFVESPNCEHPLNGYAQSKLDFDNYLRPTLAAGKLIAPVVGLRYFNVYGPNEGHKGKMASVAFHLFNQAKNEGVMRLFEGSSAFLRDFVYIDDVVNVVLHFLTNPVSGIYNCGTGEARAFTEVARSMQRHLPHCTVVEVPFPDHLKGKYQAYTCADLTALRQAGYTREFMGLNKGVERYFTYLRAL